MDTVVGCFKNHIDSGQDILNSKQSTPLEAQLSSPHSITFDNESCLLISDTLNNRVCRADFFKNTFETIAGSICKKNSDNRSERIHPHGATTDQENNLLIADRDNNKIRFVAKSTNTTTTLIGETPSAKIFFPLNAPQAITTDLKQNIFVVDSKIS
jgi:sugar lactone lactonase YvrE